jgi:hypothetical protein
VRVEPTLSRTFSHVSSTGLPDVSQRPGLRARSPRNPRNGGPPRGIDPGRPRISRARALGSLSGEQGTYRPVLLMCSRVLTPTCHQPRRYPTGLGEPTNRLRSSKCVHLQHFPAVNVRTRIPPVAFARRRSGIRIPSAPLYFVAICRSSFELITSSPHCIQALLHHPCRAIWSLRR